MNAEILARVELLLRYRAETREGASVGAGFGRDKIRDLGRFPNSSPTVKTMIKLSEYFEVSPDWLTFGLGEPPLLEIKSSEQPPHISRWRAIRALSKYNVLEIEPLLELLEDHGAEQRQIIIASINDILRTKSLLNAK